MSRSRHPNKDVEEAVAEAESKGWRWRNQGHWGRLYCPKADRDGCQIGVYGTPKNAGNHANQIRQAMNRCPHMQDEADENP